jgi:hypothetical protein
MDDYTARKQQQDALERNLNVIFHRIGASNAERVMIRNFAKMLRRGFKDIKINISVGQSEQAYRFEADWLVRLIIGPITEPAHDPEKDER